MDLNWKILFTDVSKKHTTEEAEEIFIVSTRKTTPSVYEVSKDWPHPWLLQSWQGKYGNARNYRIISPLGQEKFLLAGTDGKKFLLKSEEQGTWYLQNTACTNFATEKVSVTRFARKSHK